MPYILTNISKGRANQPFFSLVGGVSEGLASAGCRVTQPTLEDIMVHLEREAEQ